MKEKYKIEIESTGDYEAIKQFKICPELSIREYLALIDVILNYFDLIKKISETSEKIDKI